MEIVAAAPAETNKYANTVIYKLSCNDLTITDVYVGSSCDIKRRIGEHKKRCNNQNYKQHNYKVYQFIRANGGWDAWRFDVVELFPCFSKTESVHRERYWVETLNATLNTCLPGRSPKESVQNWRLNNREYHNAHCLANYYRKKTRKTTYATGCSCKRVLRTCGCDSI